jgi:tetratricopeptide (TPR) repeat protein
MPAEAALRLEDRKLSPDYLEGLRDHIKSSRGAIGVIREGDTNTKPPVVTPMYGTTITNARPAFSWPDTKAEAYLVQLLSGAQGKDERVLWKAVAKEAHLPYPDGKSGLQLGNLYRWRVTPLKGDDASAEPIVESKFLVLTKGEIKLLSEIKPLTESQDAADLLLAAVAYEAHGVYDQALGLYERLAKLSPNEPSFQVALASYFERAGNKERADKARARAKQLGPDLQGK